MTLNFPNAPTNGQIFGGYQYNTAKGVWARTSFSAIEASTANPGIVQLATANETLIGTAPSRAVTPVSLEPLRSRLTATVTDFTALAALSTTNKLEGDLAFVVEGAVYMSRVGSAWVQVTVATFATTAARDTAYAKASAVFRVARVRALDSSNGIESGWDGVRWQSASPGMFMIRPGSVQGTNVTMTANGRVNFVNTNGGVAVLNCFDQGFARYVVRAQFSVVNAVPINMRVIRNGTINAGTNYHNQTFISASTFSTSTRAGNQSLINFGNPGTTNTIHNLELEITQPHNASAFVHMMSRMHTTEVATGACSHFTVSGGESAGGTIDGLLVFPDSGNINGNLRVYGLVD